MNTITSSHVCPGLQRSTCADCGQTFALYGQSVARLTQCPDCLRRMRDAMHRQLVEAEGRDCD